LSTFPQQLNRKNQRAPQAKRLGPGLSVFLARDTSSPYVDNRAPLVAGKPENRQYKAIFVQADGEIGQASDIVTLVCLP
jgi:hypothetical protein